MSDGTKGRVVCAVCGRQVTATRDGRPRRHAPFERHLARPNTWICKGVDSYGIRQTGKTAP